jgi:hypothetical protein
MGRHNLVAALIVEGRAGSAVDARSCNLLDVAACVVSWREVHALR